MMLIAAMIALQPVDPARDIKAFALSVMQGAKLDRAAKAIRFFAIGEVGSPSGTPKGEARFRAVAKGCPVKNIDMLAVDKFYVELDCPVDSAHGFGSVAYSAELRNRKVVAVNFLIGPGVMQRSSLPLSKNHG